MNWKNEQLDDSVLLKSDGFPTYHLASVVDDHHMDISHVIRGEEWLPSTPKHLLLYQAFGWQPPQFAHAPILLDQSRAKLSKRHDSAAVANLKSRVLPAALINWVAMLGWNPKEKDFRELFDVDELCERFSLTGINQSAPVVDDNKLAWFNGQHLRRQLDSSPDALVARLIPGLTVQPTLPADLQGRASHPLYVAKVMHVIQEKVGFLSDLSDVSRCGYFFNEPHWESESSQEIRQQVWRDGAADALQAFRISLEGLADGELLESDLAALLKSKSVKKFQKVVRWAVTGVVVGGSLVPTLSVLGRETVLRRLQRAIDSDNDDGST